MPAEPSTAAFLRGALGDLRRLQPARYAEVAGRLERAPTRWAVGGERFTVTAEDGRVAVRSGWRPAVRGSVELSRGAVLDLFDGAATVEELLAADAVVVRVGADALLELSAAVTAFVAGAVAAPPLTRRFEEYRSWVLAR